MAGHVKPFVSFMLPHNSFAQNVHVHKCKGRDTYSEQLSLWPDIYKNMYMFQYQSCWPVLSAVVTGDIDHKNTQYFQMVELCICQNHLASVH